MLKLKLKVSRLIVLVAVLSLSCAWKFIILKIVLVLEHCSHVGGLIHYYTHLHLHNYMFYWLETRFCV